MHRAATNTIHLHKPADYNSKMHKYEYKAHLMMLRGGHGGIYTGTKLFFSYAVPFHSFLRTLQSETQLCTIPPRTTKLPTREVSPLTPEGLDIPKTPETYTQSTTMEADVANENPKSIVEHELQQISAAVPFPSNGSPQNIVEHELQQMSAAGSFSSNSTSLDDEPPLEDSPTLIKGIDRVESHTIKGVNTFPISTAVNPEESQELRRSSERGFTLDDGPWSYFISNSSSPPSKRIWREIANIKDYTEMVETMRRRAEKEVEYEISVVIMHVRLYLDITPGGPLLTSSVTGSRRIRGMQGHK
jgi:hypothetical protein